ncbi:putative metal homeostasis protein [Paucilactobacillus hokkaidonensis]|nr:putative metal homeostasis protein [Paucilactobacillus hokkaidonensis]
MAEKIDYASAKRRLNSRNIKTRNRAKKRFYMI